MTINPDDRPVWLGGPPGVGIAVPASVAGQLGLLPDDLSPAAVDDALTAARAELERLELAALQLRTAALDDLRAAAARAVCATVMLDRAADAAHDAGATWQQIADAAGLASRQAAWERWSARG